MKANDQAFSQGIIQSDTLRGLDKDALMILKGIFETCPTLVETFIIKLFLCVFLSPLCSSCFSFFANVALFLTL
jgi:hypothetical protein